MVLDLLKESIILDSNLVDLDMSCFDGRYVTGNITDEYLAWVENEYLS